MTSPEDAELDRDFKPSRRQRPQSMMALDFMSSLDSAFNIDNSLADLTLSIDKKHQSISLQSAELEALQEQIRKADELLEKRRSGVFTGSWSAILAANTSPHKRQPLPRSVMEETSSDDSSSEDEAPPPARVTPTRVRSNTTSAQMRPQEESSPAARRPATSAGPQRRKVVEQPSSEDETTSGSDSDDEANTNPLTQATDSSEEEKVEPKKPLQRKAISPKTVRV